MLFYTDKITLFTKGFCDIIDISEKVKGIVKKSKIKDGLVNVFVRGSTAGITTIEAEPNLIKDFQEFMEKLAPQDKKYHHKEAWNDDNGFSHLRASLIGPSLTIPIEGGKMILGGWQQLVLCDFDNRSREREIIVKIMGE